MSRSRSSTTTQSRSLKVTGEEIWKNKTEKINTELFALTYGALVAQLFEDYDNDYSLINERLFSMGYNLSLIHI